MESTDNRILFYGRDKQQYGFMSNFHPAPFELDGHRWPSVEHYYMAMKSEDPEYRQRILTATTPNKVKRLGDSRVGHERQATQSLFHPRHSNRYTVRQDWDSIKLDVMYRAVSAKFQQNPVLAQALKATGNAELVEDSPTDTFWGTGASGTGQNWLGKTLMRVRDSI